MLEIRNITKCYGSKKVLDNVSVCLSGGIYGLLGINGAGKTTLMHIMTGILAPDSGDILYNGVSIYDKKSNYRSRLGFMPQQASYYPDFTAGEFLNYMCVIKELPKNVRKHTVEKLLDRVNLTNEAGFKVKTFSGGMRQRLGIAQALLNNPDFLVLDEPTAGLDPEERIRFRNLISEIAGNSTVLLATHIVQDLENIAGKVLILSDGGIVVQGNPKALMEQIYGKVGLVYPERENLEMEMKKNIVSNFAEENGICKLRIISDRLDENRAEIVKPNLEDVFLYYTKRGKACSV